MEGIAVSVGGVIALITRQGTPHFNYTRALSPVKPASQRNEGTGQCLKYNAQTQ